MGISEVKMGTEATLLKEFVGFLPLFLLHISIGMTASFTTILIHYFEHTQLDLKEYSTLIGTSEDYVQIIIAVFGGFLQQMIGPRRFNQSINNLFFAMQLKYSCMFK